MSMPVKQSETYNISSIALDSEDDGSSGGSADNSSNSPEQGEAVQHLAESLACLVAQIEPLSELGAAGSIDGANVLNVRVDTGSQGSTLGQRRDSAWRRDTTDAEDVESQELETNSEQHSRCWHGKDTDWWVVGTCAGNQFNHDKEPSKGQIPVKPIKLRSVSRISAYQIV